MCLFMLVRNLASSLAPELAVLPALAAQRWFRRLVVVVRLALAMVKRVRSGQGVFGLIRGIEWNRVLNVGKLKAAIHCNNVPDTA